MSVQLDLFPSRYEDLPDPPSAGPCGVCGVDVGSHYAHAPELPGDPWLCEACTGTGLAPAEREALRVRRAEIFSGRQAA